MLCQICKEKNANYFYEETINGVTRSYALCSACKARLQAEGSLSKDPSHSVEDAGEDLLSLLFSPMGAQRKGAKRCVCGTSYAEIRQKGRVGCKECYTTFGAELENTIRSMHGSTAHIGRVPKAKAEAKEQNTTKTPINEPKIPNQTDKEQEIARLEKELKEAIASEAYEQAAVLRDRILAVKEGQI